MLQRWVHSQMDRHVWIIPGSWKQYLRPPGKLTQISNAVQQELDPATFKFHPSNPS
jgi:hypothetical protein